MKLTVAERLVIQNLLPKEANFVTLRLMRKLREALSFDELEIKKLKVTQENEMVKWDGKAAEDVVKDVEVGETMMNLIVKTLKEMDEKNKLTAEHITLYEKFVENPNEESSVD